MERAYVAFDLESSDRDTATRMAVGWALARCSAQHPEVVLWVPDRDVLADLPGTARLVRKGLAVLSDRPGRGPRPTPRSGPVVAFGQGMDRLVEVEPAQHPVVLVGAYVEALDERLPRWGHAYHQPWIDAFDPTHLRGPRIARREPLKRQPVVQAAVDDFTWTTDRGRTMYRSDDGGRVTHGLMVLQDAGYELVPHELFAAALAAGWKGAGALLLRQVATEVSDGKRKRPAARYRPDILEQWEQVVS